MPSSVIETMQYEPVRRSLLIVFRGGRGVYRYFDVSEQEWETFTQARSKGTYLNREFKARMHPFEKLSSEAGASRRRGVTADARWCWPAAKEDGEVLRSGRDPVVRSPW